MSENVVVGREPGRPLSSLVVRLVVIGMALLACWSLVATVGSGLFVLVHAFYLPVTLAAFWLGRMGTVAVGIVAGALAGPLLPAGVTPEASAAGADLIRMGFVVGFSVIGAWSVHRIRSQSATMQRLYARTLRGFVRALEYKDEETSEHCERVARNAVLLGRRMKLSPIRLEALYWAGYLHDVGKIATPTSILTKPGPLTENEYAVVKRHTVLGGDLLAQVSPAFQPIAEGVLYHHERWDGTGYPEGLSGTDIPLFGRILGVVDVFEALTSNRPYRAAMPEHQAAAIVREGIGSHFDPDAGNAFMEMLAEGRVGVEGRRPRHATSEAPDAFNPDVLESNGRKLRAAERRAWN